MPWIVVATLIVFLPLVLVYFLTGRKFVSSIVLATGWARKSVVRWVVISAAFVNSFPVVFLLVILVGGSSRVPAFAGENYLLDLIFVYPFWFGLVIVVQCFLLSLLLNAIRLVLHPLFRRTKERWLLTEAKSFLGIAILLSLYSIVVIVHDTWTVRIVQKSIIVSELAHGLRGKRFVLISDVQGDGRTDRKQLSAYVNQVNQLHPDLVLFAGDLVTSGEKYIESTAEVMGTITARYGRVAAVGDHDMFSDKDMVVRALRNQRYTIADDSTFTLIIDSARISISLVTNTYLRRPKSRQLEKIADGGGGDFKIFLVHQPAETLVQFAEQKGYDLFLAGHTHGGGIAFGIPGVMLFAPALLESKYMSGFYKVGSMLVVVTNGLGLTLAPIRFHAPSEITVLDFQ